jgi:uncharacterized membrane protein YcaP (DUF421 family)
MLTATWSQLGWTIVKAFLLYLTALLLLRVAERRTLADLAPFDIVAMVAIGAVIGRTATAAGTGYLVGAAALVTLVAAHRLVARLRMARGATMRRLFEHPPVVLVRDGDPKADEIRRCELTMADLCSALRRRGVTDLAAVRLAVFEPEGGLSVVRAGEPVGDLIEGVVTETGRPRRERQARR